ncbi:hypothetical protein ABLE91_23840 [Aquabacter sp. CN5-332]|uniref:hypothetical protein n=1 Tax=Aquabacter sp. CN5-332 TaxID=3156608 RepID=UPI0032B432C3
MRYLAITPLAIAAAMSFSTLAMADEYTTAQNKENYAVLASQSAPIVQEHAAYAVAPLGYAPNERLLPREASPTSFTRHVAQAPAATRPAVNNLNGPVFSDRDAHWGPSHGASPALN